MEYSMDDIRKQMDKLTPILSTFVPVLNKKKVINF